VRVAVARAAGALVAVGGIVCSGAWAIGILADRSATVDAAFVVVALAGTGLSLGLVGGFAVLPLPWNVKAGGVAAAALLLIGVATLLAFVGFVIAPLAVLCVAAAAHAAGRSLRLGGLLLLASFAAYAGGAWVLESAGEDGAYAVALFVPLFALAWIVLGYGIATAELRRRPAS
jgi:hypothetical protein